MPGLETLCGAGTLGFCWHKWGCAEALAHRLGRGAGQAVALGTPFSAGLRPVPRRFPSPGGHGQTVPFGQGTGRGDFLPPTPQAWEETADWLRGLGPADPLAFPLLSAAVPRSVPENQKYTEFRGC